MHLTPKMLEAAYEFLRTTAPFRSWKLPHGDHVEFHVWRHKKLEGLYIRWCDGRAAIKVSFTNVEHPSHALKVVAHEMIHLHQDIRGTDSRKEHNAEFKRLAKRVCRLHLWNEENFI